MRVIGILATKGQSGWDQDDLVMVPFTTAENKVLGVAIAKYLPRCHDIFSELGILELLKNDGLSAPTGARSELAKIAGNVASWREPDKDDFKGET